MSKKTPTRGRSRRWLAGWPAGWPASWRAGFLAVLLAVLPAVQVGCTSPVAVDDPMATLKSAASGPRRLSGAMQALDANPTDEAYLEQLRVIIWRAGYTVTIRQKAFDRLLQYDPQGLQRTLRKELPRMTARVWQEQLFELIIEYEWVDLGPAIVSSWARRIGFVPDFERTEYHALVQLYGEGNVIDAVFDLLVESRNRPFLRVRCWELLERLGQHDRLVALLSDQTVGTQDPMLMDLRTVAVELGVIPRNREEIIWARTLCEPSRAEFFSQAAAAVKPLPPKRRSELELRDLAVLVAAVLHDPPLATAPKDELYEQVEAYLRTTRSHIDPKRFEGFPGDYPQRLFEHRKALTWGDLAAMVMAIRATEVPQLAAHLFDYAERDRLDESCEYGGVINLDSQGRFEILEFVPRFRRHDNEFIASQAMMEAGYTALFHFHLHAQRYTNGRHAGPGVGDLNYADNTRTNCLVFTFIDKDTLNVDYYRCDRVIVDLGEVRRP